MNAISIIVFSLVMLAFVGVIIYWIHIKKKGRSILDDGCGGVNGKSLVKLYHLQKRAESKNKGK